MADYFPTCVGNFRRKPSDWSRSLKKTSPGASYTCSCMWLSPLWLPGKNIFEFVKWSRIQRVFPRLCQKAARRHCVWPTYMYCQSSPILRFLHTFTSDFLCIVHSRYSPRVTRKPLVPTIFANQIAVTATLTSKTAGTSRFRVVYESPGGEYHTHS